MNGLSWLLYLAELSQNVSVVLFTVAGVSLLFCCAAIMYGGIIKDDVYRSEKGTSEKWLRGNRTQKLALKFLMVPVMALFLACIFPSKATVYMIIASEAGEKAVKTETGKKAIEAVNRYLDQIGTTQVEAK